MTNTQMRLEILKRVCTSDGPVLFHRFCMDEMGGGEKDIRASVHYLLRHNYLKVVDGSNKEQEFIPEKYCYGGSMYLKPTPEGMSFLEQNNKRYWIKVWDHLKSPERVATIVYSILAFLAGLIVGNWKAVLDIFGY